MVTAHVPVPLQPPPDQPVNTEPDAGAAVNVTVDPLLNAALQPVGQEMPLGADVTVPDPVPFVVTVSVDVGTGVNAASTLVLALRVNVHVPVPEHVPPLHPVNVEPEVAAAVSVIDVPFTNDAAHV